MNNNINGYKFKRKMMRQWSVSSRASELTPVYLNVYSFCHCCNLVCGWLGVGVYHTAIEILYSLTLYSGIQFMFHGWAGNATGVSEVIPKTCPYRFQQQVFLGNIDYSFAELDHHIVQPLKKQFISNNYDLFNNNCNHFALAMAQRLGLAHNHPHTYIFRLTNCLNTLRCCIPDCVLSGRLDWFRSSDKENEELQQIRNSQIKHGDISGRSGRSSVSDSFSARGSASKSDYDQPNYSKAQNISRWIKEPLKEIQS